jgi:homoserine dehydrogenase
MATESMKPINVGLLGIGTVGGGTWTVLTRNQQEITRRAGRPIQITVVADKNLALARNVTGGGCRLTDDAFSVVTDPSVDIVVELIGGCGVAKELVLKAIENGKHVVTANKALLAVHGNEIFAAAQKKGVMIAFEAAVAGGIPIIKALREGLTANRIEWIAGIINGTTNFILSEMRDKGLAFDVVLKEAQRLGYAEADPTEDVGGKDAAAKMAILSSIAFHSRVTLADVEHEGIGGITDIDVAHGKALGLVPKLLGVAQLIDGRVNARVYPCFIPAGHPLAGVSGAYNAVFLESETFDKIMLFGPGAGGTPTASAVIGDVISVVNTARGGYVRNCVCYKDLGFYPNDEVVSRFYLRVQVVDESGVLATIAGMFGEQGVSIHSMQQIGEEDTAQLVLVFHPVKEAAFFRALERISALPVVRGTPSVIRMEAYDAR